MPRRGALLYALLVFLAGASLIREAAVGRLAPLDEAWAGQLARRATPHSTPARVTLVEIGDDTISKHEWPWGPDDLALFFHAVLPFEPAVLGIEPILDFERGSLGIRERQPMYEKMLHDQVLRSPKLVLGGLLGWPQDADTVPELQPMPVLRKIRGDLSRVPEFTAVDSWSAEEFRLTTQPGWLNIPDGIGPLGRCPLVLRYRGQPVPAIVLQLVMHVEKITLDEVEVVLGSHVSLGSHLTVPIDDTGRMLVNFGASFGRVSFDDLLLTREQLDRKEAPTHPPELFSGRLVMLARTDGLSRTLAAPGGRKVAAGELFAAALATVEIGAHPHRVGVEFDWAMVGLVAFSALWLRKWKPRYAVLGVVALLAAYAGWAFAVFRSQSLVSPAVLPAGLAVWVLLLRSVARRIEKVIAF
jgi:hypothetical protein